MNCLESTDPARSADLLEEKFVKKEKHGFRDPVHRFYSIETVVVVAFRNQFLSKLGPSRQLVAFLILCVFHCVIQKRANFVNLMRLDTL